MKSNKALEGWFSGIEHGDDAALAAVLDDDVEFQSPVMYTSSFGRASALQYLRAARTALTGPDFIYAGRWENETGAVLEFKTLIDGVDVNGVDIIQWSDDATRITGIKVMVRPLRAIEAVKARMAELLARQ